MTILNREQWQVLEPLLDRALDLTPEERGPWLDELTARSPELAGEVTAFLAEQALADRNGFLDAMPDATLAGLALGAYRLERPLGRGGMGTVWLARRADGRFEGKAAAKLLNLALISAPGQERFRREGSVLARLAHPGIARLLDAGVSGAGQPYLILEYVDGRPIDLFAREQSLGRADRIGLFLQVLAAVGHAHANLIVHRDLKPSNILVTAGGSVKLLDFGIAKLLDGESGGDRSALTLEGGGIFTPQYAAPEQVRGETLTTATDVYALGVLLYVLLSGRHPTAEGARTPAECVAALLDAEPRRLQLGDLDNILAKALQKAPGARYQTVAALADDLERYLRREPVSARAHSVAYRIGKFVRRNRAIVVAGTVATAGLVAATGFSLGQMRAARLERDAALRESRRADAQVEFQNALLSQVGDKSITMRQALDSARVVLEHQYSASPSLRVSMLLQLAGSYAQLGVTGIRATLLARAESLALAGLGADQLPEIRCAMADNLRTQGQYDEAWRTLNAVAPLLQSAPGPGNETACLAVRSLLASETGRAEEGVAAARRAIAIRDSLGKTRDLLYLDLLKTHALALGAGDRHRDAVAAHRRAIAAADSSGRGGTLSRAIMQHDLALSLVKLGETAEAERILRTVLGLAIQSDPTGRVHPQPLVHYAETALTQDHADSARKYFGLLVTQADTNLYWEGRGLFGLARADIRLGRVAEARRAKARLEQIIARYPHVRDTDDQVPDGRTIDGWLALAGRNPAAAKTHFVAALRSNGWFEGKRRERLRPVALLAARSALAVGDVEEALALAREAHAVAALDSLAEIRSAYVGEARLVEGRALLARGDTVEGDAAIARGLTALRHGAGSEHPMTREAEALAAELRR